MKFTLDKILSQRVEKMALDLGISEDEVLTKSINSYINVQLLKQQGFRNIIAKSDQTDGDITSWFFEDTKDTPSLIEDEKEEQQAIG